MWPPFAFGAVGPAVAAPTLVARIDKGDALRNSLPGALPV